MTTTGWIRVAYAAVLIVAAGAIASGLVFLAYEPAKAEVQVLEQDPLTQESSVKDVAALLNVPVQTGTGVELSEAVAANCPTLDVYPLADGAVLICR